jgi:hypothetical protein
MAHGSYNSVGNYVAYDPSVYRYWQRYTTPCVASSALTDEKRKLHVLGKSNQQPCRTGNYVIEVAGKKYAIDQAIYKPLVEYLEINPATNLGELQSAIEAVRIATQISAPASVRLANVPLVNVRRQTTFSGGIKPGVELVRKKINSDFKTLGAVSELIVNLPLIVNFIENNFPNYEYLSQNGHHIKVQKDDFSGYTTILSEILVSRAGLSIKALPEAKWDPSSMLPDGDINLFKPVLTYLSPYNNTFRGHVYPVKLGLLFGIDDYLLNTYFPGNPLNAQIIEYLEANSELIFIPLQLDLDLLENVNLPRESSVNFPFTNGGDFLTKKYYKNFINAEKKKAEFPNRVSQGLYI